MPASRRQIITSGPAGLLLGLCGGVGALALAAPRAPASSPQTAVSSTDARAKASMFVTLGTQSGPIPFGDRSQPANVLLWGDQAVLIDVGDGAAEQLAKAGVPLSAVRTVLISHLHFDHIGGLFGLLGMRYQATNPGSVTIYGPVGTRAMVAGLMAAMQPSFDLIQRPAADYRVIEIGDGDRIELGDIVVTAATNSHYQTRIRPGDPDEARFQSLAFRFDLPDRSIAFTGDTGPSDKVVKLAQGVDLLVSEIIDPEGTIAMIRSQRREVTDAQLADVIRHFEQEHLAPEAVGRLAREAGVKSLVLTHLGGLADRSRIAGVRARIASEYDGPITFAEDLSRF